MRAFRHNQRRGAALMLSLWALFLLSAMVISWALDVDSRLTLSAYANRAIEAQALACSGAEVAMHRQITPGAAVLVAEFGRNQRYEARITGEGGRLNLNWLIKGENPLKLEVLRKFLEIKGIELNERDRMIDTLLDWVDPDNLAHLNGAEEEPGYKPPNKQMLARLEELKKIRGWEEFTSAKDWDADLTLNSTPGTIDIAWASKNVLMALPGASEDRVDQFLSMRAGGDEIDGTEDDPFRPVGANGQPGVFDQAQALLVLGLDDQQITGLLGTGQVMRVTSVGKSGDVMRTVRVVFDKGANQLKSWKEF